MATNLYIYDEIGWDLGSKDIIDELKGIKDKQIDVHIHSPGGNVFEGVAIYNAIRQHGAKVHTYVDGLAASIASVIAMAGDVRYIADNAMMMIHEPYAIVQGSATEMRDMAEQLDMVRDTIANTYVRRTGQSVQDIKDWMAETTWMTAEEAVGRGFSTDYTEPAAIAAKFDLAKFNYEAPEQARKLAIGETQESPVKSAINLRAQEKFARINSIRS